MSFISTMTPNGCLAVATMMPIFLVGLIAERIAFKPQGKARWDRALQLVQLFLRAVIDLCTAGLMVGAILLALVGLNSDGLVGPNARGAWTLSIAVVVIVLARWVVLSPAFLYPIEALANFLLNLVLVSVIRFVIARTARRLKSGAESGLANVSLENVGIEYRVDIAYQLSEGLFLRLKRLVNTEWLPKSDGVILATPKEITLSNATDPTTRLVLLWRAIPRGLERTRDPGRRSVFAARDLAAFSRLIRIWLTEPTLLTLDVIEQHVRSRLFKSFMRAMLEWAPN